MFGSPILDVAIGMIFVYLLLSLICSAANELIEAKLKNRAKDLEAGIRNLLGDKGLADKIYSHDLISGLFSAAKGKPSYIPAKTFALALMNTVFPAGTTGGGAAGTVLESLRTTVSNLPETDPAAPIKQALLALIDDAQGDVNKLKANIEDWFNAAMDRVSGWYKRRAQVIIVVLGLLVAIALNADSAYIARHLSTDPAMRNSLVSAAQAYAQQQNQPGQNGQQASVSAQASFNENLARLEGLGLPIGWSIGGDDPRLTWPGLHFWHREFWTDWYSQIRFHWLGWLLTALAVSLGAPFWFDMLNKFIVVRSTVKPKEKSLEEKSKG